MSEIINKQPAQNRVLFSLDLTNQLNDMLIKIGGDKRLFFVRGYKPRKYVPDESPREKFMVALFNAYFLFCECFPLVNWKVLEFWGLDHSNSVINNHISMINNLRNTFAHNNPQPIHKHLKSVNAFFGKIDNTLPQKLRRARSDENTYINLLPDDDQFWEAALERICDIAENIMNFFCSWLDGREDIIPDYIAYYKNYLIGVKLGEHIRATKELREDRVLSDEFRKSAESTLESEMNAKSFKDSKWFQDLEDIDYETIFNKIYDEFKSGF